MIPSALLRCKRTLLSSAMLLATSAPLHAAPEVPAGDAVLQLLQDRGLLPSAQQVESNAVVQQMRDTASDLVMQAMNFLGVPYRLGGNSVEQGSTWSCRP